MPWHDSVSGKFAKAVSSFAAKFAQVSFAGCFQCLHKSRLLPGLHCGNLFSMISFFIFYRVHSEHSACIIFSMSVCLPSQWVVSLPSNAC